MTAAEIRMAIAEIAHQHLEWNGSLRDDQRLVEDLALDSLKLLTLAIEVENRFRINLSEDDEGGIVTVGDLVRVVARRISQDES